MEEKVPIINKVRNRILFLSPTVKECLERECKKEDFISELTEAFDKGGFSTVWKVRNKVNQKTYAIKIINKKNIIEKNLITQVNREIEIMYRVNHKYIVKLVNHFEDDENLFFIMNFASKGQLYKYIKRHKKLDQKTSAQILRELICALKYLHTMNPRIIHRDIKPENILIDDEGRIKLADFGWSNYTEDSKKITYCGTPEYLAPEMINKEGHDMSLDIWCVGVLLFELLAGYTPFCDPNKEVMYNNIKKLKIKWPEDFPNLAKNLVLKILKLRPEERPTLDEILAHPWFDSLPVLREVINEIETDPQKILESHLINVKQKDDKQPKIISKRISREQPQEENSNTVNPGKETKAPPIEGKKDSEGTVNIYKTRIDKLEHEIQSLKIEINKLTKEKSNYEIDNFQIKDELEKYKIINKERLSMIADFEVLNNELFEAKSKVRNYENDIDLYKLKINNIQRKYEESLKENEFLEEELKNLQSKYEEISTEKEKIYTEYKQKMKEINGRIFNEKMLDKVENDSAENFEAFVYMINQSVEEVKKSVNENVKGVYKLLVELNEKTSSIEGKILELINSKSSEIKNLIDSNKAINFISKKSKTQDGPEEKLEWLKKIISELMPYKNKCILLESEKGIKKIDIVKEKSVIYDMVNTLNLKISEEKDYKINELEKTIKNLQDKLLDVEMLFKKNYNDKIDEFHRILEV